jgi:hypothetical protein
MKLPLCSQTRTGNPLLEALAGVQMLSMRQSSFPPGAPVLTLIEGQLVGGAVAMTTAGAHGARGCGGRQRRFPIGAAAYGTPR